MAARGFEGNLEMPDLSIIVVTWNSERHIERCLASVYRHTRDMTFEVVVVDNASADATASIVESRFPQARLIRNDANTGFAKGNNIGLRASAAPAVILLNPDTELTENSLKRLHGFLFSDERIGACGGTLVHPNGAPEWSFGHAPSLARMLWITASGLLHIRAGRRPTAVVPEDVSNPLPVEYIVGADLMVKRSVLDQVGPLDERFFAYFEETDLCCRIRQAGYGVWYTPRTSIIHHIEGSFQKRQDGSNLRNRIFYTSLLRYLDKHDGHYLAAKHFMLAKQRLRLIATRGGTEDHETARLHCEAIRNATLEYPFDF